MSLGHSEDDWLINSNIEIGNRRGLLYEMTAPSVMSLVGHQSQSDSNTCTDSNCQDIPSDWEDRGTNRGTNRAGNYDGDHSAETINGARSFTRDGDLKCLPCSIRLSYLPLSSLTMRFSNPGLGGTGLTIFLRCGETKVFRLSHPYGHPTLGLSESVLCSLFASPKFLSELG